ncbi:hypothetical protein HaLaN_25916, partial [Haematococcus lacustris]
MTVEKIKKDMADMKEQIAKMETMQPRLEAMQASLEKVEGMIEGIHGIMKHKSEEEARARQGVQAPLQASSGTQWTPAGYRALSLRVFQVGEEKEFQAAVMEN